MGKDFDEFRRAVGKVPWLTSRGIDLTKFPLDDILRRAVGEKEEDFRGAVSILKTMQMQGRVEAGVFLLGLVVHSGDNWQRRTKLVEALRGFDTRGCADFLFSELRRVKSNSTTRRYLAAVLEVLQQMPLELIQNEFVSLASDPAFSPRMRNKFADTLWEASRSQG